MNGSCFVAFDVETPNAFNHRMSAIGVSVIENQTVTDEFYSLVNPECDFDYFNIQLTGITPEIAMCAPNFADLWPTLESYLNRGILVAHSASFDMSVLAKCLNGYGIHWRDTVDYACTVRMGKYCFPEFPNHKLNTMSELLNIDLNHHRADSDSRACAEILIRCMERHVPLDQFVKTYDVNCYKTLSTAIRKRK